MAKPNSKGMAANGRSARLTSFAGIPRAVMETDDYKRLPANAKCLLLEFAYQFRGRNNGDLTAAWSVMRERGWKSQTTLCNALQKLLAANLILCTRQGRFMNPGGVCALYALTWNPIDECKGKHDVGPTTTAPRKF